MGISHSAGSRIALKLIVVNSRAVVAAIRLHMIYYD